MSQHHEPGSTTEEPVTSSRPDGLDGDAAIRAVVARLARTTPSGEAVIERAAILAEGTDSGPILRWILAHTGRPEAVAPRSPTRGLHGPQEREDAAERPPRRYVLPAGVLRRQGN